VDAIGTAKAFAAAATKVVAGVDVTALEFAVVVAVAACLATAVASPYPHVSSAHVVVAVAGPVRLVAMVMVFVEVQFAFALVNEAVNFVEVATGAFAVATNDAIPAADAIEVAAAIGLWCVSARTKSSGFGVGVRLFRPDIRVRGGIDAADSVGRDSSIVDNAARVPAVA
jgi:hypothetical protein